MNYKDIKKDKTTLIGLWGALIAALCCFTPLLVWVLAFFGLAALTTYLDYVLIPILLLCIGIFLFGLRRIKNQNLDTEDT